MKVDSSPLITIVIPTYNRAALLLKSIGSVLAQTYTNWELFVVDDGSTDGTKECIRDLNDQRIHLISVPHCGNVAVLRNTGIALGTGEWVSFLDSDDLWMPEKLERQLEYLLQQGRLWSYGAYELMTGEGESLPLKTLKNPGLSGWITKELLTNETSAIVDTLLVSRKLFEEVGGFDADPRLIYREDLDFTLRLSLKAEVTAVPELLLRVLEHTGRSTNTIDDAHKRTAFLYEHFSNYCPDRNLKKIARKRQAYHEAEAAVKNISQKKYGRAFLQLSSAARKGDKLRHILSSVRRGIHKKQE